MVERCKNELMLVAKILVDVYGTVSTRIPPLGKVFP